METIKLLDVTYLAVPELKPSRGRRHTGTRVMGRIIHFTRAGGHSI